MIFVSGTAISTTSPDEGIFSTSALCFSPFEPLINASVPGDDCFGPAIDEKIVAKTKRGTRAYVCMRMHEITECSSLCKKNEANSAAVRTNRRIPKR